MTISIRYGCVRDYNGNPFYFLKMRPDRAGRDKNRKITFGQFGRWPRVQWKTRPLWSRHKKSRRKAGF